MSRTVEKSSDALKSKRTRTKSQHHGINKNVKNYDEIFEQAIEENALLVTTNTTNKNKSDKSLDISITAIDQSTSLSVEEVLPLLAKMSATIKYLTGKISDLHSEIKNMKNTTTLQVGDQEVTADEMPLLMRFESFELPISDANRLDSLENILKTDKTFYIFFVSVYNSNQ